MSTEPIVPLKTISHDSDVLPLPYPAGCFVVSDPCRMIDKRITRDNS